MQQKKFTDSIYMVIDEIQKTRKKDEKIKLLQEYDYPVLKAILMYMYDKRDHECLLPKGEPPFQKQTTPENSRFIHSSSIPEKMRAFYKSGGFDGLTQMKRETLFIDLLESLHEKDAQILIDMKEGRRIKGITARVVNEAYPGLIQT